MNSNFELFDKKLIILLVLKESGSYLSIDQIAKICVDFENITYFDIREYLDKLLYSEHILEKKDDQTIYYELTEKGINSLEELEPLIPGVNLHHLKKIMSKEMVSLKKDYEIGANVIPLKHGEYKVSCYIKDGNDELINITLYAGDKDRAKQITDNWQTDSSNIYIKIIELMTKS